LEEQQPAQSRLLEVDISGNSMQSQEGASDLSSPALESVALKKYFTSAIQKIIEKSLNEKSLN